jgi:Ca-activated chloride channel family protein
MMRSTEFAFQSPGALLLLVVVPVVLLSLFQAERRRRQGASMLADPGLQARSSVGLLTLAILCLFGGLAACGWVLLATALAPFDSPIFIAGLTLLGLVALLATLAVWLRRRNQPVFIFPSLVPLKAIREGAPSPLRLLAPFLRAVVLGLLIVSLARPQVATTEADVFAEGMDIVLTVDVSTSMEAVDFAPKGRRSRKSRIKGAKEVIRRFIEQRQEDRLGLVVFAAQAFTQCPLSLDYSILVNILKSIKTGAIDDGTAIGNALMVSVNRLRESDAKSKAIILLTDGDDNASKVSPVQAAEIAKELDIRVFPILVGRGGKVPYPVGPNLFGQMQYRNVEIRTNPDLLEKIAKIAEGKFYRAIDQAALEEDFQDILDQMEKTRLMDPGRFTRHTEVFQLALLPALLALLLELSLRWTRFRRFP